MAIEREKQLVVDGSACTTNFFDRSLLTLHDYATRGTNYTCPNWTMCESEGIYCALQCGREVAAYVLQKRYGLKKEMGDFSKVKFIEGEFWNSVDGKEFSRIKGIAKVLRAVEGFARVILLMNPFESIFPSCNNCDGAKLEETVFDSIWDGPFPCSGSGKTRKRTVLYCPQCESKPIGIILKKDPDDEAEIEILRRLRDSSR